MLYNIFSFLLICIFSTTDSVRKKFWNINNPMVKDIRYANKHFLTPVDFENAQRTPVKKPSEHDLQAMQLPHLFEGDIKGIRDSIDTFRYVTTPDDIFKFPQNSALNLATFPDKLWHQKRVPYILDDNLTDKERWAVAQAFDEYKEKTCIKFVPKEAGEADFVHIKKNDNAGCSSYVGRAGGNQTVSLEVEKCFSKGIIAHELMHVLGFFHEHSRVDRDDHISIIKENVTPEMMRNFEKYTANVMDTLDTPYDFGSVMHYHKLAFSRNGSPTIVPLKKDAEIGQRLKLSDIDAEKVNILYKCRDEVAERRSSSSIAAPNTTTTAAAITGTISETVQFTVASTIESTMTSLTTNSETIESTTSKQPKPSSTAHTLKQKPCKDSNDHCRMWSNIGHCKWSYKYMYNYCKKSCNLCDSRDPVETTAKPTPASGQQRCEDKNLFCSYWSRNGQCQSETKFMHKICTKACNLCEN